MKTMLWLGVRVAALSLLLLIARIIAALVAGIDTSSGSMADDSGGRGSDILWVLLFVCFLESIAWTYPIRHSRWTGWKLVTAVFLVTFGVMTLQPQIEAIYFEVLELELSMRAMLMGIVTSLIFAPAAVLFLGRWKKNPEESAIKEDRSSLEVRDWAVLFVAAGLLYVVLYMSFGHFVAWQSADVRAFYDGPDELGGLSDFGPFAIPSFGTLQFLRGLLWTALGIPVLKMMKTDWWKSGLALGVLLALVMNAQLLIPNAIMPTEVRLMHFIETAPSNFLFGFGVAWIFRRLSPTGNSD